jgi:hypothetical protein
MEITKDDEDSRVYSPLNKWGTIKKVDKTVVADEFGALVLFDNGYDNWFRLDGTRADDCIFWGEIEEPPRPKRKVKREGWSMIWKTNGGDYASGTCVYLEKNKINLATGRFLARVEWEEEV